MATFRVPMLGFATVPDASGNVFMEPFSIKAVNGVFDYNIFIFNDTATRIGLRFDFPIPSNYISTPEILPIWTSTAIVGNVVWDLDGRVVPGDDTTSLDQAGTGFSATVTDAAPTAAFRRLEPVIAPVATSFVANATLQAEFFRDGTAADTMAAAAQLHGLIFKYDDV